MQVKIPAKNQTSLHLNSWHHFTNLQQIFTLCLSTIQSWYCHPYSSCTTEETVETGNCVKWVQHICSRSNPLWKHSQEMAHKSEEWPSGLQCKQVPCIKILLCSLARDPYHPRIGHPPSPSPQGLSDCVASGVHC